MLIDLEIALLDFRIGSSPIAQLVCVCGWGGGGGGGRGSMHKLKDIVKLIIRKTFRMLNAAIHVYVYMYICINGRVLLCPSLKVEGS